MKLIEKFLEPYKSCINEGKFIYDGRTFELKIPNPFKGCALFNYMISYKLPFGLDPIFHPENNLPTLPISELETLQKLCLQNCFEVLPKAKSPVIDESGQEGVLNTSDPLFFHLTSGYLLFFGQHWGIADLLNSDRETPNILQPKQ
jgi:hypothetical protein